MTQILGKHFFYVLPTFDDVLSPKIAKNLFTPFKGRDLEILAKILVSNFFCVFSTFHDVLSPKIATNFVTPFKGSGLRNC